MREYIRPFSAVVNLAVRAATARPLKVSAVKVAALSDTRSKKAEQAQAKSIAVVRCSQSDAECPSYTLAA